MKKTLLVFSLIFCVSFQMKSQESALSPEAAMLFKGVKTKISNEDKNEIFLLTGFKATPDKSQFYFTNNNDLADFPFSVYVYPLDLNNDGKEEIGVVFGNIMVSGNAGSSAFLFIKNDNGNYVSHLGFPGSLAFIYKPYLDFPDVLIGEPGMVFPLYRWTGKNYEYYEKVRDTDFDALRPIFMEEASNDYTNSLKN